MGPTKHRIDAAERIDEYIAGLPEWSKKICNRLRQIVLKSDPRLIEDWKWGPHYYCEGMVCGFAAFQKHVNLVFFQGSLLTDKKKRLLANPGTLHNRHLRYTDLNEIDEEEILAFLLEAIDNNRKNIKRAVLPKPELVIAKDIINAFKDAGVSSYFLSLPYSHKKEYLMWIEDARREVTRQSRIEKAITKLQSKEMMHDKYKINKKAPVAKRQH